MTSDVLRRRLLCLELPQVEGHAELHLHRDLGVARDDPRIPAETDQLRVELVAGLDASVLIFAVFEFVGQLRQRCVET